MNLLKLPLAALFWAFLSISQAAALPIKVLIVEGASNHDWQHRIEILRAILSRDGTFDIDVSVTPGAAADPGWVTWSPVFSNYDVVLSGYSNGAGGQPRWPAAVEAAFVAYVSGGGGFVSFHEAGNSFADWPAYNQMLGLRWYNDTSGKAIVINTDETLQTLQPGQGAPTSHGQNTDVLVKRLGNHPIHAGLPLSWMTADLELWRYSRGPAENLTVLSYAKDAETQLQFPVEWTTNYGSGRVYASTYGHIFGGEAQPRGTRDAAFQETLVRALKWCAGINPPPTVPQDFPTASAVSLRAHKEGFSGFGGPVATGPFANGVLPNLSIVPTGVAVVPAFPALQWESPVDAKPWPESTTDLIAAEMDGRIYRLVDHDSTTTRQLVLDIQDRVWYYNWDVGVPTHKHGGILSLVFHPKFGKGVGKDYLYVYHMHHPAIPDDPDLTSPFYDRLSRFTWNGTAFNPASEQILINQYDTTKGHEGGGMAFGDDGFLYLAFGDEGTESGDATPHTQKINDRARSGVWRIDVDQQGGLISHPIRRQPAGPGSFTANYHVPGSNPWQDVNGGILEEFYSIGLREPHRMSFDAVTGLFWVGDVGANNREEIDVIDAPGLNFEWSYKEGIAAGFGPLPTPYIGTPKGPVHDYSHSIGNCVIGGHVYRGTAIPFLQGKYLFGDNNTQFLYAVDYDPVTKQTLSTVQFGQGRTGTLWNGISSFGIDSKGEPLLLQMGAGTPGAGTISRIKPQSPPPGASWTYPPLLSETGVFADVPTLTPAPGMIPYDVNMPLWSAGMDKKRWVMIPNDGNPNTPTEQITYTEGAAWQLPVGSVFVKHFAHPGGAPLETRLMVHGTDGWGGVTYVWRADGLEADLLEEGGEVTITRGTQTFEYLYPSRNQCRQCHTDNAGPVLGFRTRQLNRDLVYPGGVPANQIESLSVAGFINQVLTEANLTNVLTSADIHDPAVPDEFRVRSYFDSNCSHCHQPGGSSRAFFDARLTTPLNNQALVCGSVIDGLGAPAPAVVKPGSLENSVLFNRMNTLDECCSMPPLAKGIIDNEAVAHVANWILGMDADSCTKTSGFYGGGTIGLTGPTPPGAHGPDGWNSNIVINEDATYTNATGATLALVIDRFQFNAGRISDPVTPFIVKVNADNNFTVLAIGTTRTGYGLGANDLAFSDGPSTILLKPGETVAIGFLDAFSDGSGGTMQGVIDWEDGGAEIWYGGGDNDADSGSVTVGQPPVPGANLFTTLNRNYQFNISYIVSEYHLGNGPAAPNGVAADGANENFVINESDIFTNLTPDPITVTVERFRFHASRVTDPVTPFVVRVNGDNDFTVIGIGTTRAVYNLGQNDVPFASGGFRITIAPGEKVAPGFMDSLPNGTGGTQNGAISYADGGDEIFYYNNDANQNCQIALGQPFIPAGYLLTNLRRDYYFSVSLGFGGKEDEDGDGLPDRWELAFSPLLTSLSGNLDSDGDGMTDAAEHQAATDPTNAASVLMTLNVAPNLTGSMISTSINSVPGRSYKVITSSNLQNWTAPMTVKAAGWPAVSTQVVMPVSGLPPGADKRLFVRVSPN